MFHGDRVSAEEDGKNFRAKREGGLGGWILHKNESRIYVAELCIDKQLEGKFSCDTNFSQIKL